MNRTLLTGGILLVVFYLFALPGETLGEKQPPDDHPAPAEPNRRVQALFDAMRTGKDQENEFPKLELADVPALLELADSAKPLKTFPRSPFSSQYEPECSEGMVALWLIEGVRQGGKFPSLNALCFKTGGVAKDWTAASEANHAEVAKLYRAWWKKAASLAADDAKAIAPLRDSGFAWH